MSLLVDSQLIVWSGLTPERLGDAIDLLEQEELFFSAASAWELAIKQIRESSISASPSTGSSALRCGSSGPPRSR